MMMRSVVICVVVACATAVGAAVPASAQTRAEPDAASTPGRPLLDLAISYALSRDSGLDRVLPSGWVAAVSVPVSRRWSLVGEAGGGYKTTESDGQTREYRAHAFMGGARVRAQPAGRLVPFGQALLGVACYCGSSIKPGNTAAKSLAWQVGVGADTAVTSQLAVRTQADYRRVHADAQSFNQWRFAIGAVLSITR